MKSLRSWFPVSKRPNLLFWSLLIGLNMLLFLPLYLFNREDAHFFPGLNTHGSFQDGWTGLLIWRENLDVFRLSVELIGITGLWVLFRPLRQRLVGGVIVLFYLLTLAYYLYEAVVSSLFGEDPNFYSQYPWAVDGLTFFAKHLEVSAIWFVLVGMGFLLLLAGISGLVWTMLRAANHPSFSLGSRIGMGSLIALALTAEVSYGSTLARPDMVVSSLAYKLQENAVKSQEIYHQVSTFDDREIYRTYDFSTYPLARTPNIYLLFIESYGSILYKRPDYRRNYLALLDELEQTLGGAGWLTTTSLTEATTWGGGSWMDYTTALFGLRIDNHPQYLLLFDKYQARPYPHLGEYLNSQGYTSYRLSSIEQELKDSTWLRYRKFYGADQWLRYRDLNYVGPGYGWGPAPPDQYALNFAEKTMRSQATEPYFFFFITQNSHYPWTPHPTLVDDWQSLNDPTLAQEEAPTEIDQANRRQNYWIAVDYQLRFLTRFILDHGEEDAIFVLVGDHQPQMVSRRNDGYETPIHIVSRNPDFIDAFQQYGFVEGLAKPDALATIRHEGFYTLFLRSLLSTYGVDPQHLPPYLPEGVTATTQVTVENMNGSKIAVDKP